MDRRKFNGGARPGAGRKPKAAEESLQQLLTRAADDTDRVLVIKAIVDKAKGGDMQAARLFLEMAYGKPRQAVEVTGADGGAIEFDLYASQFDSRIAAKLAAITGPEISGQPDE